MLCSIHVHQDYIHVNTHLQKSIQQILKATERSAGTALSPLSKHDVSDIIDDLFEYDFIFAAKIFDKHKKVIAEKSRHNHLKGRTQALTNIISTEHQEFSIDLIPQGSAIKSPAQLSITVDMNTVLKGFYIRTVMIILIGFIAILILASLLYTMFHMTISRPVFKMINQAIELEKQDLSKVRPILSGEHIKNELGQLTKSVNTLFAKYLAHLNQESFSGEKYRAMFESSSIGMALNDSNGKLIEVNQAYLDIIGYTEQETYMLTFWDLTPKSYDEQEQIQLKLLNEKGRYGPYEKEYIHKKGHLVPVLLNGVTIIDSNHESYTWSYIQDVTERRQSEEQLKLSSRVFTDTHEGITITDADMNIIDINPAFSYITGYSREDVIGKTPRILNSGKQSPKFYQGMWQEINEQGHWQGEIWNRKKDGEIYAELLTISSLTDEDGIVVNYVGVFSDITSSKKQQEQLSLMAHYDVLTGLPNRALFVDRFHQAIAHSKRTNHQLAICFLDLDNFKPINDNYGHEVGDKLLIEVAERVNACVREEDTVSRQGGDEFAILLNDIESYEQCKLTLERIHHSLSQPYIINGSSHSVTASAGLTLYPNDDGDIDTLLRHADQAMYQAKLSGKHRYQLFNPENDQLTIKKHHQLDEIGQALLNSDFQLYFQPKVNMVTGSVFGVEALIRWNHPEKGLIPPLDFLPIIEGTELEIKIGNWVINEALTQLKLWHQQGIRPEVSINISSPHLLSETFFADLDAALTRHSTVDSQCLQIEILESSALGDLHAITSVIEACQEGLGVKVALDDFGTGYSSLTHLRTLPIDTIKIDQVFVRDMIDDPSDYAIIDGIIGLADSFGREVIAEGVETTNHGLILLMMGCEEAQGYGIAKPMPAEEYPQWLSDYTPNQAWLNYGTKHRTIKENKIKLFRLIAEQWKDKFIDNIQSSTESIDLWPIMSNKGCPCGSWIKRAEQEQLFEVDGLKNLNKTHKEFHVIAQTIQQQYQGGDITLAREGIPKFKIAFEHINSALKLCE